MSISGVDTFSNVSGVANKIKNKGYEFVCRYYGSNGSDKIMGTSESSAIYNAGLKRVVVFQNKHNAYSKFSENIAQNDAASAISQAKKNGQAYGVIYFAVDYDATAAQVDGNIKKHFKVLKNMLNSANYSVGVYGSTLVCKKLKNEGIVSKTWLTISSGWGYDETFTNYNIKQTTTTSIGGISFDKDIASSLSDIGAW